MAKEIDLFNDNEFKTIINPDNQTIVYKRIKDIEKEVIPCGMNRIDFNNMMDKLTIEQKNNLIKYLGLQEETIEIHKGYPEYIKFNDYLDCDNNFDYAFRQQRNLKTSDIIYNYICRSKGIENYFFKFFE